jgi:hypothetical protein
MNYGKQRSINVVSVFLVLLALSAVYAGWKFIPPWWQATRVDAVLEDFKYKAADLSSLSNPMTQRDGEQELIDAVVRRIQGEGVDDPELHVYLSPDDHEIDAEYKVVIHHPIVNKKTVLTFHRKVKVPSDARGL